MYANGYVPGKRCHLDVVTVTPSQDIFGWNLLCVLRITCRLFRYRICPIFSCQFFLLEVRPLFLCITTPWYTNVVQFKHIFLINKATEHPDMCVLMLKTIFLSCTCIFYCILKDSEHLSRDYLIKIGILKDMSFVNIVVCWVPGKRGGCVNIQFFQNLGE